MIDGEAVHHTKDRGWVYYITFMSENGEKVVVKPSSEVKSAMKSAGLPPELLPGSGDVAACVRMAHALRLGMGKTLEAHKR